MTSLPGQAAACARYEQQRTPLFTLGTVLITPGALDMLEALQLAPLPFVLSIKRVDWDSKPPALTIPSMHSNKTVHEEKKKIHRYKVYM